jgi:hypothetical protein
MPDRRTIEQVRGEIEVEREQLAEALGTLGSDAKRAGLLGSLLAVAGAALLVVRRVAAGRRRD